MLMEEVKQTIEKIFHKTVKLHGEPLPVCTICAEEMFRSIYNQYREDERFSERGKVISLAVNGRVVQVKVATCAYVFGSSSLQDGIMTFLAKQLKKTWSTISYFTTSDARYLIRTEVGRYTYMETTPIQHKNFGPVHYVLLVNYDGFFVAYDASFQQFLTAVGDEPAYLVFDKSLL